MPASPQQPNKIGADRYLQLANVQDSITALAGGAQPTTPLSAQLNRVTVVASANDSVALPKITNRQRGDANLGGLFQFVVVTNADSADSLQVFGMTPDTINDVATGTGVAISAGKTALFIAQSYVQSTNVGNWVMILSA